MLPDRFSTNLRGLSFDPAYPANVHALHAHDLIGCVITVEVIAEPDNPHDSNAVAVRITNDIGPEVIYGHLPGSLAARMAPGLAAGEHWTAVVDVREAPDHPNNPGAAVTLERVKELAHGHQ